MWFWSEYVKEFSVHAVVNTLSTLASYVSWLAVGYLHGFRRLCFHNYVWVDKFSTAGVELLHVQISRRFHAPLVDFDTHAAAAVSPFAESFNNFFFKPLSQKKLRDTRLQPYFSIVYP